MVSEQDSSFTHVESRRKIVVPVLRKSRVIASGSSGNQAIRFATIGVSRSQDAQAAMLKNAPI